MGHSPGKRHNVEAQVKSTKQRNHHLPIDHGCSSHLLTSTSWWSSQKRTHTAEHTTTEG